MIVSKVGPEFDRFLTNSSLINGFISHNRCWYNEKSNRCSFSTKKTIFVQISDDKEKIFEKTKKKGVKRRIPLMWIDQEININEDVIRQLQKEAFYHKVHNIPNEVQ
jgi:hypothetical protein